MIILDQTIVNVALPAIQADLGLVMPRNSSLSVASSNRMLL